MYTPQQTRDRPTCTNEYSGRDYATSKPEFDTCIFYSSGISDLPRRVTDSPEPWGALRPVSVKLCLPRPPQMGINTVSILLTLSFHHHNIYNHRHHHPPLVSPHLPPSVLLFHPPWLALLLPSVLCVFPPRRYGLVSLVSVLSGASLLSCSFFRLWPVVSPVSCPFLSYLLPPVRFLFSFSRGGFRGFGPFFLCLPDITTGRFNNIVLWQNARHKSYYFIFILDFFWTDRAG